MFILFYGHNVVFLLTNSFIFLLAFRGLCVLTQQIADQFHIFEQASTVSDLSILGWPAVGNTPHPQIQDPRLPFISIRVKGYVLSTIEIENKANSRQHSNSPPPFTLEDLNVTVAIPTTQP